VNLAVEAERLHHRSVLLVELALRLGVIAAHLDLEPKHSIHDLLGLGELDLGLIRQTLTPVAPHLHLLAGPPAAIRPVDVRSADILRIVKYSRALADLIIVDVPCTYDDLYFDMLAAADHYVLVLEQSVPAVRSFRMVHEALQARNATGQGYFVVNRYNPRLKGFTLEDLQRLQSIPKFWSIAADPPAFSAAVNNGRSLFQEAPGSPGLADIDALAAALVGAPPPAGATKPNLFARLVRACRLA
jgi:Flp pilus assembly CpaE family ATPase